MCAAIGAVVLISGCAASSTTDPVAEAVETTQSLPGASVVISGEVVSPVVSWPLRFSGRGALTNLPQAAAVHLDFGHLVAGARSGPVAFDMRILRHVFFFRLPFGRRLGGRRWLKIDERRTARAAGLGSLPAADELDPDQYLTYLRAVSGGLIGLGFQLIHGIATTGYRGEIDLEKVAERAPADRRAATVAAVGNLEHITGVRTVPFQVWIDAAHRVRRLTVVEGESSSNSDAVTVYLTEDFVRFGHEPRVSAPPAHEVFDATPAATAAIKAQLDSAHPSTPPGLAR